MGVNVDNTYAARASHLPRSALSGRCASPANCSDRCRGEARFQHLPARYHRSTAASDALCKISLPGKFFDGKPCSLIAPPSLPTLDAPITYLRLTPRIIIPLL